ncbi:hypothetical protein F2P56_027332 [Juglans regia]|uniref:Uncharacterized protein LOC108994697 isoform X3 n=2 Tax=Juglans regia TaxID=51240 RepID=A0A2I4F1P1_JUGRE|nr:uncharacterized protein LOC108994697 isoform X3 [Juglans regia]XP_035539109.1 uncharacterized protein LOC108994697 isoform X3 [Juglans regia]KAF5452323.1 hypothetical protein F2P56_027332 [Juglans regia]
MPKQKKATTTNNCKHRSSVRKFQCKWRPRHTSATTDPKMRLYQRYHLRSSSCVPHRQPYFLRSSGRSSYKHTIDDVEVVRDHDLWSGGLEKMLVDILYQETLEGKLVGARITNHDTVRLATRLNQLGIRPVDASQVKGKIVRLKKTQREFTDLIGQMGMGWNPITKTVVATEEHWANAIRVRSQWKKYKTNGCANYDILCMIFDQAVATKEQQLEEELRARGPVLGSGVGLDSTIDLDDISMTPSTQGGVSQRRPPCRRRRDIVGPSYSPELSAAIQTLAATSKQRADLDAKMFEQCSSKRSRGEGSNSGSDAGFSSVAQCMKFLQDITPPLPSDVHLRAVKAFMDPNVLIVFQHMPPEMRIQWVWSLG